ncbi:proline-rich protein HaeIII subfamily 1-like [Saccopteryx leptura]|uniref:proline-rich protein HaeIII subfamily 1-like n=1 Tax=Saccopteryx leptura TaxID=249018 RepID=UPI00339C10E0
MHLNPPGAMPPTGCSPGPLHIPGQPRKGAPASRPWPRHCPAAPPPPEAQRAAGAEWLTPPTSPRAGTKRGDCGQSRPHPRPGPQVPGPARPQPPARRGGGGGGGGEAHARMPRPPSAGSPEVARAARSGAAARAPPPSASHPQVPLGPGPARSLAAEPSVSAPGGAYEDVRQPRPGCHWFPSPRPHVHWLPLTAPPLPSARPINTSRAASREPRLGGRWRQIRLPIGQQAGTRQCLPTCPLTGFIFIGGNARQPRRSRPTGERLGLGLTRTPQSQGNKRVMACGVSPSRGLAEAGASHRSSPALVIRRRLST